MLTTLQFLALIDMPVLIAIGGLGASFLLSACHLGLSLVMTGKRP